MMMPRRPPLLLCSVATGAEERRCSKAPRSPAVGGAGPPHYGRRHGVCHRVCTHLVGTGRGLPGARDSARSSDRVRHASPLLAPPLPTPQPPPARPPARPGPRARARVCNLSPGRSDERARCPYLTLPVPCAQIAELFKQFGEVESIYLLPNEGAALVNLTIMSNAVDAKQALDGLTLGGNAQGGPQWTLNVTYVRPQPQQQPRNTLM